MSLSQKSLILFAVLALTSVGCAGSGSISVTDLADADAVAARAHDFWQAHDPPSSGKDSPRIVIAEFSLEYETGRGFSKGIQIELPGLLYRSFVQAIAEFGAAAVPLVEVSDSDSYQKLAGASLIETEVHAPTPANSASGLWHPVDGLLVLDENQGSTIAGVLKDTRADIALQVRLKIGLDQGRAMIRPGSTLRAFTADKEGWLESKLGLVSEEKVVDEADGEIAVDSRRLVTQSSELFRKYISMALVAAGVK